MLSLVKTVRIQAAATMMMYGLVGLSGLLGVGCAGGSLSGRVISGPATIATVVEESDERFTTAPGVADASIELRQTGAAGTEGQGTKLSTATSGATGQFTVKLGPDADLRFPVQIIVNRAGFAPLRATVQVTDVEKKVLVILRPLGQ